MNKNSEAGKMSLILGALIYPSTGYILYVFNAFSGRFSGEWWQGLPHLGIVFTTLLLTILVFILGIIGLVDKEHSKSFALIGCILGFISILLIAVSLIVGFMGMENMRPQENRHEDATALGIRTLMEDLVLMIEN